MRRESVLFHIDCRKSFCHPCGLAETKIPALFFEKAYDEDKFDIRTKFIYEDLPINGISDKDIIDVIDEYIGFDFVVAEGYACRFWLESNYAGHLLLVNPEFREGDDIDKLFRHPENTYVVLSSEYKDRVSEYYEKFLTPDREHTFLYYGEKCCDIYKFYGFNSTIKFIVSEILAETEYWKIDKMISDSLKWKIEKHEFGYDPEYVFETFCFRPNEKLYKTIYVSLECLKGIENGESSSFMTDMFSYKDGKFDSISKESHRMFLTRNLDNVKFCNGYAKKAFKERESDTFANELPIAVWFLTDHDGNEEIYVDVAINFASSKKDIGLIVDDDMTKLGVIFDNIQN